MIRIFLIIFLGSAITFSAAASDWKAIPEESETKTADEKGSAPTAANTFSESGDSESEKEEGPAIPSGAKLISGVVRFTRSMPETEIFIKDAKDSVFIPNNSKHNSILAACEESRKNKTVVQLIVETKSRQVLRLATEKESQSALEAAKTVSTPEPAKNSKPSSSSGTKPGSK